MRKAIALSAASAAFLAFIACKNGHAVSITSTMGAGIVTADDTVNLVTARRCDREIDCKNVGAGKRYDDRGACERELLHQAQEELGKLGRNGCTYGVREERLEQCMADIRVEGCLNSMDSLDRVASCRANRLCIE